MSGRLGGRFPGLPLPGGGTGFLGGSGAAGLCGFGSSAGLSTEMEQTHLGMDSVVEKKKNHARRLRCPNCQVTLEMKEKKQKNVFHVNDSNQLFDGIGVSTKYLTVNQTVEHSRRIVPIAWQDILRWRREP